MLRFACCRCLFVLVSAALCALSLAQGNEAPRDTPNQDVPNLIPCRLGTLSAKADIGNCGPGCGVGNDEQISSLCFHDQYHVYEVDSDCTMPPWGPTQRYKCGVVLRAKVRISPVLRTFFPVVVNYNFPVYRDRWRDPVSFLWTSYPTRNFEYHGSSRRIRFWMTRVRKWQTKMVGGVPVPDMEAGKLEPLDPSEKGPGNSERSFAHQPIGNLWESEPDVDMLTFDFGSLFFEGNDLFRAGGEYEYGIQITNANYDVVYANMLSKHFFMPPHSDEWLNLNLNDLGPIPDNWQGAGSLNGVSEGLERPYDGPPATMGWWEQLFTSLFVPSEESVESMQAVWSQFATWGPNALVGDIVGLFADPQATQEFHQALVLPDLRVNPVTSKLDMSWRPYAERYSLDAGIDIAKTGEFTGPNGVPFNMWPYIRMVMGAGVWISVIWAIVRKVVPGATL